jgi:hypothetical protein
MCYRRMWVGDAKGVMSAGAAVAPVDKVTTGSRSLIGMRKIVLEPGRLIGALRWSMLRTSRHSRRRRRRHEQQQQQQQQHR